jgi:hypothetical protein
LADVLEQWHRYCSPETTVALHDAMHALQRAIFAAQEFDAVTERPGCAENWIG